MLSNHPQISKFAEFALVLCKSDRKPENVASLRDLFTIAQQANVNLSYAKKLGDLYLEIQPLAWLEYGGDLSWPCLINKCWVTLLDNSHTRGMAIKTNSREAMIQALTPDESFLSLLPPFERSISRIKKFIAVDDILSITSFSRIDDETFHRLKAAWVAADKSVNSAFLTEQHLRLIQELRDDRRHDYYKALVMYFKQRGCDDAISALHNYNGRIGYYEFTYAIVDAVFTNYVSSQDAVDLLSQLGSQPGKYHPSVSEALTMTVGHCINRSRSSFSNDNSIEFLLKDWPHQLLNSHASDYSGIPFILLSLLHTEKTKSPEIASTQDFKDTYEALREFVIANGYGAQQAVAEMLRRGDLPFILETLKAIDVESLSIRSFKTIADEISNQLRSKRCQFVLLESEEETISQIKSWPPSLTTKIGKAVDNYFWQDDVRKKLDNLPGAIPLFRAMADIEQWNDEQRLSFATRSRSVPVRMALIPAMGIDVKNYGQLPAKLRRELLSSDLDI